MGPREQYPAGRPPARSTLQKLLTPGIPSIPQRPPSRFMSEACPNPPVHLGVQAPSAGPSTGSEPPLEFADSTLKLGATRQASVTGVVQLKDGDSEPLLVGPIKMNHGKTDYKRHCRSRILRASPEALPPQFETSLFPSQNLVGWSVKWVH